jgi:hypothetical protein
MAYILSWVIMSVISIPSGRCFKTEQFRTDTIWCSKAAYKNYDDKRKWAREYNLSNSIHGSTCSVKIDSAQILVPGKGFVKSE